MNDTMLSRKFFRRFFGKEFKTFSHISDSLVNISSKNATALLTINVGDHADACAFILACSMALEKSPNA